MINLNAPLFVRFFWPNVCVRHPLCNCRNFCSWQILCLFVFVFVKGQELKPAVLLLGDSGRLAILTYPLFYLGAQQFFYLHLIVDVKSLKHGNINLKPFCFFILERNRRGCVSVTCVLFLRKYWAFKIQYIPLERLTHTEIFFLQWPKGGSYILY